MCLYPRLMLNKKYTRTKKNGGIIPPIYDQRTRYVPIGCQLCIECKKQKARAWQARLLEDIKENKNGKFITLTFSNESIKYITEIINATDQKPPTGYDLDNQIAIKATRLFLERWRKIYKKSLRHWLITEIGHNGTENIHLHGIIWTNETQTTIQKIWNYGYIWPRNEIEWKKTYVNEKTVNYIIKYVTKIDVKHKTYNNKILTSPGIGQNYTTNNKGNWLKNKFQNENTQETYRTRTGQKISLPIYWRNKIYTEEEKEKLWIEKLNKEERWILGNKIDISKGDEEYQKALKYAQQINMNLGYGKGQNTEALKKYENERRKIMQETRIKKAQRSTPSLIARK